MPHSLGLGSATRIAESDFWHEIFRRLEWLIKRVYGMKVNPGSELMALVYILPTLLRMLSES